MDITGTAADFCRVMGCQVVKRYQAVRRFPVSKRLSGQSASTIRSAVIPKVKIGVKTQIGMGESATTIAASTVRKRSITTEIGITIMANSTPKAPTLSPWRTFEEPAAEKASSFLSGTLGVIAIALGVGAIGIYALDYHRHRCNQCGSRWGHFGAFNMGDEDSHTCSRCGQVQWWKSGEPHVLHGSQFVAPPGSAPALAPSQTFVPDPALVPMYVQPPAPAPVPVYGGYITAPAPVPVYAQPPVYTHVSVPAPAYALPPTAIPSPGYGPPLHAPARAYLAGNAPQLPPPAPSRAYARAAEYARPLEYARAPEYARPPEYARAELGRGPEYARGPEYGRDPYARDPDYARGPEPSTALALRPRERWR